MCAAWYVIGICWILNLESFTLHCFRGGIFWWWSVGWYHKCEFLHHEPFRHLSPKTIIVQKLFATKACMNMSSWRSQTVWRLPQLWWFLMHGKHWCMLPAGRDSVVFKINHKYKLVKLPPKKKCLLVLIFIFKSKHSSFISQGKPSSQTGQTPQFRWWLRCWMCSVATCPKHVPKNVIQLMFCSQGGDPLTDAWN